MSFVIIIRFLFSISGVASQSVNNVFSATYQNYKIITDLTGATGSGNLTMKLRASGTDSSASYYVGIGGLTDGNVANNLTAQNVNTGWLFNTTNGGNGEFNIGEFTVFKPQLAVRTLFTFLGHSLISANGNRFSSFGAGFHDVSSAFTGFTLLVSTGNISGKVSVYGYNE